MDFKDYPKTIGELRCEKGEGIGAELTPRDILIGMLRAIDNGFDVEDMIICFKGVDKHVNFDIAGKNSNLVHAAGMLEMCKNLLLNDETRMVIE